MARQITHSSIDCWEFGASQQAMAGGSEGPSGSPKKRKGLRKLLPRSHKKHGPALLHRASVDPIRRAALQQESQRSLQVQAQASVPCETHYPEGICTILSMQGLRSAVYRQYGSCGCIPTKPAVHILVGVARSCN